MFKPTLIHLGLSIACVLLAGALLLNTYRDNQTREVIKGVVQVQTGILEIMARWADRIPLTPVIPN